MSEFPSNLIVVDTETTGVDLFENDLISYAFVPLDRSLPSLSGFVDPGVTQWSDFARSNFSKFKEEWEQSAESPAAAIRRITDYITGTLAQRQITIIGHNVAFDRTFLNKLAHRAGLAEVPRISHRTIDTHSILAFMALKGEVPPSAVTSDGAFSYFGIEVPDVDRHSALGDALATAELFRRLFAPATKQRGTQATSLR